ncbi:MAG: DoxX family protein [Pseudomonadota bacterium]
MTITTDFHGTASIATTSLISRIAAPASATLGEIADTALRVVVGLFLVPHGAQKLFGAFGGHGLEATGQFFETQLGFWNGFLAALAAGSVETFGGLALALGLATRPVAIMIAVMLAVAASVHIGAGFFWTNGGWEYAVFWAVAAAVFAVKGGGRFSLDALIARR